MTVKTKRFITFISGSTVDNPVGYCAPESHNTLPEATIYASKKYGPNVRWHIWDDKKGIAVGDYRILNNDLIMDTTNPQEIHRQMRDTF